MLTTMTLATWIWTLADQNFLELQAMRCPSESQWLAGEGIATKKERNETRQRVADTCMAMGATAEACTVLDELVVRESSGDTCAVHVLGPNEHGLGPLGLSVGLHLAKWNADADATVLRVPEVSAIVTMRIFRRAVGAYNARNWRAVAAVFAGRFGEDHSGKPMGDDFVFCERLRRRHVDCNSNPRGKLGKHLGRAPERGQEDFARELASRW
jgi:hypothetical protein